MRLFLSSFCILKQQDLFPPNLALKQFANINLRGCFPSLLSVDIESAVIEKSCLSINVNPIPVEVWNYVSCRVQRVGQFVPHILKVVSLLWSHQKLKNLVSKKFGSFLIDLSHFGNFFSTNHKKMQKLKILPKNAKKMSEISKFCNF